MSQLREILKPQIENIDRYLVSTTLLALILRILDLDESYWIDETITLWYTNNYSYLELLTKLPLVQPHPPGYYIFLKSWNGLGLDPRHLSIVFGVLTIPVLYYLTKELYGKEAGFLSCLFVAVSPFFIRWSQQVRMYSLLGFLSVSILYIHLEVIKNRSTILSVFYIFLLTLSVYLHYYMWILFFLLISHYIYRCRDIWIPKISIFFSLPSLFLIYNKFFKTNKGSNILGGNLIHINKPPGIYDIFLYLYNITSGHHLYLVATVSTVVFISILIYMFRFKRKDIFLCFLFISPIVISIIYSYLFTPIFQSKYLLFSSVFGFILLGGYLSRIDVGYRYLFLVLVLSGMIIHLPVYYGPSNPDIDSAANYLSNNTEKRDLVVVDYANMDGGLDRTTYGYYLEKHNIETETIALRKQSHLAKLDRNLSMYSSIYVVDGPPEKIETKEIVSILGHNSFCRRNIIYFFQLDIYRYQKC